MRRDYESYRGLAKKPAEAGDEEMLKGLTWMRFLRKIIIWADQGC